MLKLSLPLFAFLVLAPVCFAENEWPQFQGPNRNGVSNQTVSLAPTWPAEGPKVAWAKKDMGTGFSGAVVDSGKVYILDRVNDQQDVLRCLDLNTGAEEWTLAHDAPAEAKANPQAGKYKGNYNGSRNQPAVDESNIYILGPFGDVQAVSKQTHQALWSANIIKDYGANLGNWGICQSPVLYKQTVIVAPLSKQAGLVAFDKTSGKEVWKSEPLGEIGWTSPLVATVAGVDQVVMLHSRGEPRLTGLDAASGKKLWEHRGWKCPNPIASAIALPEGQFFFSGGYGSGCVLVKASNAGGQWKVEEVFKNNNCGSQAQNPIFYQGCIYATSNDTKSGVMCMDLKGEVKWKTSNENPEEIGSLIIADGKIFSLLSEQGVLRMLAASPEGYKEMAKAKITEGANIWGPMAIADGKLLVRNRRTLLCLDLKAN